MELSPGVAAAAAKQVCAECQAHDVTAVTRTALVVYIRCKQCGAVWTLAERRKSPRSTDRREF